MTYMSSVIDLPLNKLHPIDVSIADMHELIIYLKTTTIYVSFVPFILQDQPLVAWFSFSPVMPLETHAFINNTGKEKLVWSTFFPLVIEQKR